MSLYQLGTSTVVERAFEKATEQAILSAQQGGVNDPNVLTKRMVAGIAQLRDAPLMNALAGIPGFDHLPNLGFAVLAEMAEKKADGLWPGRSGPEWVAMRTVVKSLAPALRGIGEGTADAAQRLAEIDGEIDKVIPPTIVGSTAKGKLSWVVVVNLPGFGPGRPVFPVVLDANGDPEVDPATGNFICLDAAYNAAIAQHVAQNSTTTRARSARGNTPAVPARTTPPPPVTNAFTFKDWAQLASTVQVDPALAQKLLDAAKSPAKKHKLQLVNDHTAAVLMAIPDTCAEEGRLSWNIPWYTRETMETLMDDVLNGPVSAQVLDRYLANIDIEPDGTLSEGMFMRIYNRKDMLLGGNQTIPQQGLGFVWHTAQNLGRRFNFSLTTAVTAVAAPIFALSGTGLALIAALFLLAFWAMIELIMLPADSSLFEAAAYAAVAGWGTFVDGIIITFLLHHVSFISKLWKKSEGEQKETGWQRIVRKEWIFGFLIPGLLLYGFMFGMSPAFRMVIPTMLGMALVVGYLYKDIDQVQALKDSILKTLPLVSFVLFAAPITILFAFAGIQKALGYDAQFVRFGTWLGDSPWHWVGTAIVLLIAVALLATYLLRNHVHDPTKGFKGWRYVGWAILALLAVGWWQASLGSTVTTWWSSLSLPTAAVTAPADTPATTTRAATPAQTRESSSGGGHQAECAKGNRGRLTKERCVKLGYAYGR